MNTVQTFDYEEQWNSLKEGLMIVFGALMKNSGENLTMKQYGNYYNMVYQWFTQPLEETKLELYVKVTEFLKVQCQGELLLLKTDTSKEVFIQNYFNTYSSYTAAMKRVHNIMGYMHRYWVPSQNTAGQENVKELYPQSLFVWRETVFLPLKERLGNAINESILEDRKGERTDLALIKKVLLTYEEIALEDKELEVSATLYVNEFENAFIEDSAQYYQMLSNQYIGENSVSHYMLKAEERLKYEETLAENYLLASTNERLVKCVENQLIQLHNDALQSEFQMMLQNKRLEDMKRFFGLLSRIEGGLDSSSKTLRTHIEEKGRTIIQEQAESVTSEIVADCVALINSILEFFTEYQDIIHDCFSDHKVFVQAMDEAFKIFINEDITSEDGNSPSSISAILNIYVDYLLKGKEKLSEDQMEQRLTSTVKIFVYLDDKDLFYESFRNSLSQRLLNRYNEDAEKNFIGKLKTDQGDSYTHKLEGMFNDIKLSEQSKVEYQEYSRGSPHEHLSVSVLNQHSWPLASKLASKEILLPTMLSESLAYYEDFFSQGQERSKKLTWLHEQGVIALTYICPGPAKGKRPKKYELSLSVIQASILLMFNESKTHTLEAIKKNLNLDDKMARMSLFPLIFNKLRVLAVRGPDGKPKAKVNGKMPGMKQLKDKDLIFIIPVKSNKLKIQYPAIKKTKERRNAEKEEMKLVISKQRCELMDLAIVRIMKSRNVLDQQELFAETARQLVKFFQPDIRAVKRRIENLMERDFLKRDETDPRKVHYVA